MALRLLVVLSIGICWTRSCRRQHTPIGARSVCCTTGIPMQHLRKLTRPYLMQGLGLLWVEACERPLASQLPSHDMHSVAEAEAIAPSTHPVKTTSSTATHVLQTMYAIPASCLFCASLHCAVLLRVELHLSAPCETGLNSCWHVTLSWLWQHIDMNACQEWVLAVPVACLTVTGAASVCHASNAGSQMLFIDTASHCIPAALYHH